MLRDAPPCAEVIREFAGFIEGHRLVAHNAAFDRRFLEAELDAIGLAPHAEAFACSMRIARRIYPQAPNHKLATLVDYRGLARKGAFHRALADAEMTAQLWLGMLAEVAQRAGRSLVPFGLMQRLEETPKRAVDALLADWVDPA
jgi:DNA polymerase-3 subunit epsilon